MIHKTAKLQGVKEYLLKKLVLVYIFLTGNKSHQKTKTNNAFVRLSILFNPPNCLLHSASKPFVCTEHINL